MKTHSLRLRNNLVFAIIFFALVASLSAEKLNAQTGEQNGSSSTRTVPASRPSDDKKLLTCAIMYYLVDATGRPSARHFSAESSVVIELKKIPPKATWILDGDDPVAKFHVEWSHGLTCLVDPMPGCRSDEEEIKEFRLDFLTKYSLKLMAKEDGTEVTLENSERFIDKPLAIYRPISSQGSPVLKLKLKKQIPYKKGPEYPIASFIDEVSLFCHGQVVWEK